METLFFDPDVVIEVSKWNYPPGQERAFKNILTLKGSRDFLLLTDYKSTFLFSVHNQTQFWMIQKHHPAGVNTANNMLTQINEEKLAVLIFTLCSQRPVM